MYQRHTSRLTELWSLPRPAKGLNTNNNNNNYGQTGMIGSENLQTAVCSLFYWFLICLNISKITQICIEYDRFWIKMGYCDFFCLCLSVVLLKPCDSELRILDKYISCIYNYSRCAQLSVARSHRQLTFTGWNIIFLGPQNGIWYMSSISHPKFWSGTYVFGNCLHHCITLR